MRIVVLKHLCELLLSSECVFVFFGNVYVSGTKSWFFLSACCVESALSE